MKRRKWKNGKRKRKKHLLLVYIIENPISSQVNLHTLRMWDRVPDKNVFSWT